MAHANYLWNSRKRISHSILLSCLKLYGMIRSIVSILVALFSAVIIIFLVEYLSQRLYPMPESLDYNDYEALSSWIKTLPVSAMIIVILGWFVGSFTGAYIVSRMDELSAIRSTAVVGTLLLVSTIINLVQIPHPNWMWIGGVVSILCGTYLGHWVWMYIHAKRM